MSDLQQLEELKDLLGTESGDKWISFMDYVHRELSLILKRGKPKKIDIENSIIGKAGFQSWREMIEESEKKGGLGWNYGSFDLWKRSYSVVLEYPYLRELELTASQINTIKKESKPNFPKSMDEFKRFSGVRKEKQIENHQKSLKEAQNASIELKSINERLKEKLNSLDSVAKQLAEEKEKNIRIQTLLDSSKDEIADLKLKISEYEQFQQKVVRTTWINRIFSFLRK